MVLSDEIRPGDFGKLWIVGRFPQSRGAFSAWVRERFGDLQKKLPEVGYLANTIGWQCDEPSQSKTVAFFEPKLKTVEGMQRSFDEGLARSQLCVQVRTRELTSAGKWLDAHK